MKIRVHIEGAKALPPAPLQPKQVQVGGAHPHTRTMMVRVPTDLNDFMSSLRKPGGGPQPGQSFKIKPPEEPARESGQEAARRHNSSRDLHMGLAGPEHEAAARAHKLAADAHAGATTPEHHARARELSARARALSDQAFGPSPLAGRPSMASVPVQVPAQRAADPLSRASGHMSAYSRHRNASFNHAPGTDQHTHHKTTADRHLRAAEAFRTAAMAPRHEQAGLIGHAEKIAKGLEEEALKAEQLDLFGGPPTQVGPKPKKVAAAPGVPRAGLHAEKVHVGGAHPHEQTVWKAEAKPVAAPQAPPRAPGAADHLMHHSDAQIGVKRAIEAVGAAYPNARDYPPGIAPGAHGKATAQIQGWRNSLDGALKATVAGRMAAKARAGTAGPANYEPPPLSPTPPMGKPDTNDTSEHLAKHGIIAPHVDHNTDKAGLHGRYLDAAHAVGEAARHMRKAQASAPNPEEYGAHAGALEGIHGHLKALAAHTHPAAQPHHEHERLRKEALGEFERAEEHHGEMARTHPSAEGRRLHGLAAEFNAHARREVAGLRAGTADFKHQVDGHIRRSRAHATDIHRNDIAEEQASRVKPAPAPSSDPYALYTPQETYTRQGWPHPDDPHDGHDVSHLRDSKRDAHAIGIRNARRGEEEAGQTRSDSADWHSAISEAHQGRAVAAGIRGSVWEEAYHATKRDEHRKLAIHRAKHSPEMGINGASPDQIANAHGRAALAATTKVARSAHMDAESAWRSRSSKKDASVGKHNEALKKARMDHDTFMNKYGQP